MGGKMGLGSGPWKGKPGRPAKFPEPAPTLPMPAWTPAHAFMHHTVLGSPGHSLKPSFMSVLQELENKAQ